MGRDSTGKSSSRGNKVTDNGNPDLSDFNNDNNTNNDDKKRLRKYYSPFNYSPKFNSEYSSYSYNKRPGKLSKLLKVLFFNGDPLKDKVFFEI